MQTEPYLYKAYSKNSGSLYSKTLFAHLSKRIQTHFPDKPVHVLDIGCADRRAQRILRDNGIEMQSYVGVDRLSEFQPDLTRDALKIDEWFGELNNCPDVILLTDILEHFEGGVEDIGNFLNSMSRLVSSRTLVFISCPQLYRLDAFKFNHLKYSEHVVRQTGVEWASLIGRFLEVHEARGVGFASVWPYILMLHPAYSDQGRIGEAFFKFRSLLSRIPKLELLDLWITKQHGKSLIAQTLSNALVFECFGKRAYPK